MPATILDSYNQKVKGHNQLSRDETNKLFLIYWRHKSDFAKFEPYRDKGHGFSQVLKNIDKSKLSFSEKQSLAARDTLIIRNTPLVNSLLNKRGYYTASNRFKVDDMLQRGIIGLISAVDKYQNLQYCFSTFAYYKILSSFSIEEMSSNYIFSIPQNIIQLIQEIKRLPSYLKGDVVTIASVKQALQDKKTYRKYPERLKEDRISLALDYLFNGKSLTTLEHPETGEMRC